MHGRDSKQGDLMEKLLERFKKFGFTGYEAAAYLALLAHGSLTASGISKKSQIPYNRSYDVLSSLIERGFVQELGDKPRTFIAVEPDVAFLRYSNTLENLREEIKENVKDLRTEENKDSILKFSTPKEAVFCLKNMIEESKFELTILAPNRFLPKIEKELGSISRKGVTLSVYTENMENMEKMEWSGNIFIRHTDRIANVIAIRDMEEIVVVPSLVFDFEKESLPSGFKSNFPEILFSYYIYMRDIFNSSNLLLSKISENREIHFSILYHLTQLLENLKNEFKVKGRVIAAKKGGRNERKNKEMVILNGEVVSFNFLNEGVINNFILEADGKKVKIGGPFSILEEYEEKGVTIRLIKS